MRFLSEQEKMRYRAAEALGLKDKLLQVGWAGLTAAESGKIGGWISAEKRRAHGALPPPPPWERGMEQTVPTESLPQKPLPPCKTYGNMVN